MIIYINNTLLYLSNNDKKRLDSLLEKGEIQQLKKTDLIYLKIT